MNSRVSTAVLVFVIAVLAACARSPSVEHLPDATVDIRTSTDLADARDRAVELTGQLGTDRVLVAFDLDNTLLTMATEIGADQWYDWQKSLQDADHCDPRLVPDRLAVQGALFHVGAMRPTQEDAADLVRSIQATGVPTLLITARGKEFRLPTFRELRRNGFDFRDSAIGPAGGFEQTYTPVDAQRPVRYEDGVYMLAGQHKGRMLLDLLDRLGLQRPDAVVFVDDKTKNIAAMKEALHEAGIRGTLFHYTRESPRVAAFDGEQADRDWQALAPALRTIEAIMGSANFDLPENSRPVGCP